MEASRLLDNKVLGWIASAGLVLLACGLLLVLLLGMWQQTALLSGLVGASLLLLALGGKLPRLFGLLFVLAALFDAAGFVWGLYHTVGPYDEIAHGYTAFATTLAFGSLAFQGMHDEFADHGVLYWLTMTSFGIAIGALWEIGEWVGVTRIEGSMELGDTISDLALDSGGAALAGACAVWFVRHERRFAASDGRPLRGRQSDPVPAPFAPG